MIHIHGRCINRVWYCGAFENGKVFAVSFGFDEKNALRSLLEALPYGTMFVQVKKATSFHESVINVLSLIYEGKHVSSTFPLDMERLPKRFQHILKAVANIPCGYVATYGGVAQICNTGPRVVGRAMATNPFPLLIPCHRVVRSDLTLAGYSPRKDVRLSILKREQQGFQKEAKIRLFGKTLSLFPVEEVIRRLAEG